MAKKLLLEGRVHRVGDDVNTDEIIPAKYLSLTEEDQLGRHCLEAVIPHFFQKVKKGDILVAGRNFGCGSSREHAPRAIKGCGISLCIAKSFARIFYRNAINIGLPILTVKETEELEDGDIVEVDLAQGLITTASKKILKCEAFPEFMQGIIKAGGLMPWVKKKKIVKSRAH